MSYVLLRYGDHLPTVAIAQLLLNQERPRDKELVVDGIFGPQTRKAVVEFQKRHRLQPDGVIGRKTWPRLAGSQQLQTLSAVDITDPELAKTELADLRYEGADPVVMQAVCNGVGAVVQEIIARAPARLVLLRLYGHGAPGTMGISDGVGVVKIGRKKVPLQDQDMTALTLRTIKMAERELRRLFSIFNEYTSVEFHGCRVAGNAAGRKMLKILAQWWQVPVSAGLRRQYAGGTWTFRFEGPVYTAFPGGLTLKSWASTRTPFPKASIA
ncbi:peptidoglycan-binding protein [Candidatus Parcubacteria bacterium]|nr:MAG: peptidoglycan-binding protein [Candidatus Parcubacteria bacterium]